MNLAVRPSSISDVSLMAYLEKLETGRPVHLGLLTNPRSRQNTLFPIHHRLAKLGMSPDDSVQTIHPSEIQNALTYLLFHRNINVLAINGGDGTIHTVVNVLWNLLDEVETLSGVACPAPLLLLLNGGTMNMASRAMNTKGNATRTVKWFINEYTGKPLGGVPIRKTSLMEIRRDTDRQRTVGLIFGSELTYNALWMYALFGQGYLGLARLCLEAAVGAHFNTSLWRKYGHMLTPPTTPLEVDGVTYPNYSAVLASTVDLTLALGLIQTVLVAEGSPGFFAKIVLETDPKRLIALIPSLMSEARHPRILDIPSASLLRVRGAFTLDGELYPAPENDPTAPVTVSVCSRRLHAVHNHESAI
ncbi:MAG: hypothetical protein HUU55_14350 [Myxococcales bacterium]|nr:hypothetical protein [Myxococcales bacterium]